MAPTGCAVDPTLSEQITGTWRLSDSGFSCATDESESSLETLEGVFDDIILEVAGTEARITRTLGACEEVFEFIADTSRAGELLLQPQGNVECTGCEEDADYCATKLTENWTFFTAFSSSGKELTLTTFDTDRGFGLSCSEQIYEEADEELAATYYTPPSQIVLNKD